MLMFFFVPGIVGTIIASGKGRSAFGWFALCAIFAPAIIVIIFLKPAGVVPGKYKQCTACMEIIAWQASVCKHCQTTI